MGEIDSTKLLNIKEMLTREKTEKEVMEILRIKRKAREKEALQKIDPQEIAHAINDAGMESILKDTLSKLREMRPNRMVTTQHAIVVSEKERNRARHYATTITEMEKVVACFKTYIVGESLLPICDLCKQSVESVDHGVGIYKWFFHPKCYLIVAERLTNFMEILLLPEQEFNEWLEDGGM